MGKMLTVTEAAEHFQVSTATIRRWIRSGRVRSQLTLGPFGEQWMIDSDSDSGNSRPQQGYVPVDQLTQEQELLKEAEQAVKEAWEARQAAEQELAAFRTRPTPSEPKDLVSLRCDLEGSERERLRLAQEVGELRQQCDQAWEETRTALGALKRAYQQQEELQARLAQMERESQCLRRVLSQRVGGGWESASLSELFLGWEAMQDLGDWPTASLEGPSWSQMRRVRQRSEASGT